MNVGQRAGPQPSPGKTSIRVLDQDSAAQLAPALENCARCNAAIRALETPCVWCNEVVCTPCWSKLDARERRNSVSRPIARERLGFAAAAAIVCCIGGLYLLAGVKYQLPGACTIGGAVLLTGLVLIVVARPWSSG